MKKELEKLTTLLGKRGSKIYVLKAWLVQINFEGPCSEEAHMMRIHIKRLNAQVANIKDQLLNQHIASVAHLSQFIQSLAKQCSSS